jgi:antitoxin MazE
MLVSIVQIGNSKGIRLPKSILRELNITDKVEMTINKDELIIKKADRKPRQGWNEAFANLPETKEDTLLLPEYIDNESFEWVW